MKWIPQACARCGVTPAPYEVTTGSKEVFEGVTISEKWRCPSCGHYTEALWPDSDPEPPPPACRKCGGNYYVWRTLAGCSVCSDEPGQLVRDLTGFTEVKRLDLTPVSWWRRLYQWLRGKRRR